MKGIFVALPHRHHLIIHFGAGPIHFVYDSNSSLAAAEIILKKNSISTIFALFSKVACTKIPKGA